MARLVALGLACLLVGGLAAGCGDDAEEVAVVEPTAPAPPPPLPQRTIPVLCFHDLGENVQNFYSVNIPDMEQYLAWLNEDGYETVTVRDVVAFLNREGDLPEKPIVISFDDAWKSALTIAKPMFDKYGYVGVAFVMSNSVGATDKRLSWDDLIALDEAGWEIASHSKTHENLTKIAKGAAPDSIHAMVEDQIYASKDEIEANAGVEVTSLALPYGNYDTFVLETIADAGYTSALSIDRGPADEQSDQFLLPRTMIVKDTSFETFKRVCNTKALHVADLDPPRGSRVTEKSLTVTATLADDDVTTAPRGEVQGKPLSVSLDAATRQISFSVDLGRGANSLVLRANGRETSWLLICDG